MNIQKAVEEAMKIDGFIVSPRWKGLVHIKPTNSQNGCILYGEGQAPGPRWQPRAKELMANDWEVTTEELH